MSLTRTLKSLAVFGVSTASLAAFAIGSDTFMNGQSIYGQPSQNSAGARSVDLGTAQYINVRYGETVTFRSDGQQFSWTFDGLDLRGVEVAQIAPPGFSVKPLKVYVGQNPFSRR